MPITLYDASVPVFSRALGQLAHLLEKGEAHAQAQGLDAAALLDAKLAPDMFPLTRQVQVASDAAKFGAARLAGITAPSFPDTERSFAELQQRVTATIEFLGGIDRAQIDGQEERPLLIKVAGNELRFTAQGYLLQFALPNFFFHVTTAYALLRHNGVMLGKRDYLGRF